MAGVKNFVLLLACVLAVCSGFQFGVSVNQATRIVNARTVRVMRMSEEPAAPAPTPAPKAESTALVVPADKEAIEVSAGLTTFILGSILINPIGGLVLGSAVNYISKQDSDASEVARGVGKVAIDSFNFVSKIFTKYDVGDKTSSALGEAVSGLKEKDTQYGVIEKAEATLKATSDKIAELDAEYDLKAKTGQVLVKASEVSTAAVEVVKELNEEYKITDKAVDAAKKAVESASKKK